MINGNKISNPRYVDLQKTLVSFQLTTPEGVTTTAQLKVPPDRQRGQNPYWDAIMDNFDIEKMRRDRNDEEVKKQRIQSYETNKRKANEDNKKLVDLFNRKTKLFALSFIKNAPDTTKAAIRRCSDDKMLDFIYFETIRNKMQAENLSFLDIMEMIENEEEALAAEKDTTKTNNENSTPA